MFFNMKSPYCTSSIKHKTSKIHSYKPCCMSLSSKTRRIELLQKQREEIVNIKLICKVAKIKTVVSISCTFSGTTKEPFTVMSMLLHVDTIFLVKHVSLCKTDSFVQLFTVKYSVMFESTGNTATRKSRNLAFHL